jgi:hypothetical protein
VLLPPIVKSILMYGGLVVAGLGVLFYIVVRDEKAKRVEQNGNLPEAKLVSGKDPERIGRWLPPMMVVVGLGLALLMWLKTTDLIFVRDDGDHHLTATREVRLLGSSDDYTLAPGHKPHDYSNAPTWIINESSREVQVKTVRYGRAFGFGNEPTRIPAGTAASFRRIDHIGPSDPPPSTVMDNTKLGMGWREWLTW